MLASPRCLGSHSPLSHSESGSNVVAVPEAVAGSGAYVVAGPEAAAPLADADADCAAFPRGDDDVCQPGFALRNAWRKPWGMTVGGPVDRVPEPPPLPLVFIDTFL